MKKLLVAVLALAVATPALARKVAGVEFPDIDRRRRAEPRR